MESQPQFLKPGIILKTFTNGVTCLDNRITQNLTCYRIHTDKIQGLFKDIKMKLLQFSRNISAHENY